MRQKYTFSGCFETKFYGVLDIFAGDWVAGGANLVRTGPIFIPDIMLNALLRHWLLRQGSIHTDKTINSLHRHGSFICSERSDGEVGHHSSILHYTSEM